MQVKETKLTGNTFYAIFNYEYKCYCPQVSPEYFLCNVLQLQFKIKTRQCPNHTSDEKSIFVRFTKNRDDGLQLYLKFSSDTLFITERTLYSNNGAWQLIYEDEIDTMAFDVTAVFDIVSNGSSLRALYEDMDFADFRLRSEDGTVFAHKAALAAASPVLLRMLAGKWKEAAEGVVDLPGTSKATLQNLKKYIYLQELPDTGVMQLLLLATYYIMPDLEEKCKFKLLSKLSSENAFEMLDFAVTHKQTSLAMDILEIIQIDKMNIKDIRKSVSGEKVLPSVEA